MSSTIQALVAFSDNLDPFANMFFSDAMDPGIVTFMPAETESSLILVESIAAMFERMMATVSNASDQLFSDPSKEEKPSKSYKKVGQALENGLFEIVTSLPKDDELADKVVKTLDKVDKISKDS